MAVVKQIATFLGKEIDDNQLGKNGAHCSLNEMQIQPPTILGGMPVELRIQIG